MTERTTNPTTPEGRARMRRVYSDHPNLLRLLDDIAERDALLRDALNTLRYRSGCRTHRDLTAELDRVLVASGSDTEEVMPATPAPGAKCSNGAEFWCSLHCPLEHGPVNSGGKNCGWTARAVCSEHCAP